jgi:hypothetical protein
VSRAFLVIIALAVIGGLAGCSDMFSPPQLPDLGKTPYDFGVLIPPYTGGTRDMAISVEPHDLASTD